MRENFAYSTVFTFVLTFVLVLALAWIYGVTEPQVRLNQQEELARATLTVLGLDLTEEPVNAFKKQFGKMPAEASGLEETTVDGKKIKVVQFSGMGLWDRIYGVMAVNNDVSQILGLSITEQKETPGLGGRIVEIEFQEQFRGEKIGEKITMTPSAGGAYSSDRDDSAFDAVSGATLTSTAFAVIINDAIEELKAN
ncbi:FMN-binding protein [Candidatus Haliotispira prima]|uniref:FMN-binding protein n=1 Tax=Candidatus Haliotispira prima TaxID=3034016 RepID=A0ABY8MIC3_9SPIO|nr:FMN-binding protein [Candidatus Haliotispira prima]